MRDSSGVQIMFNIGRRGKWDGDLGSLAVVAEEPVQIAGVFGKDKADDIMLGKVGVPAPFTNEKSEGVRVSIRAAGEELGIIEYDRRLDAGLIGWSDRSQVRSVVEEMRDQLDGGAGMLGGGFGTFVETREEVGAALDADAIPDVISEDDVVSRDDALRN